MWSNLGLKPIFLEGDVVAVVIDLFTHQVVKVLFLILFTSNAFLNNTIQ